jgi:hypothetical protein
MNFNRLKQSQGIVFGIDNKLRHNPYPPFSARIGLGA